MKKTYLVLILAVVLMTALSTSCKKGASGCRITRIYSTDSFSVMDIIYDGDLISRADYHLKSGASQGYSLFHHSSTGKLSGYEDLDSTGIILRKTEYFFDTHDRVISEYYYVKSGSSLPLSAHYGYDYFPTNNNLQKYTRYDNGTTVMETSYFLDYDANGNNTKGYDNNNLDVTVDTFFYTYDTHPNFLNGFDFYMTRAKNNPLTHTYKPTVGSIFTDTYLYRYNEQGYVTYQHETADGDDAYIDYDCSK